MKISADISFGKLKVGQFNLSRSSKVQLDFVFGLAWAKVWAGEWLDKICDRIRTRFMVTAPKSLSWTGLRRSGKIMFGLVKLGIFVKNDKMLNCQTQTKISFNQLNLVDYRITIKNNKEQINKELRIKVQLSNLS